jgi:hypothetical protein
MVEIHRALVKEMNCLDEQVTINGFGYRVRENTFESNHSKRVFEPDNPDWLAMRAPGTAILVGLDEIIGVPEIITTGGIPHVSIRCLHCGQQLEEHEIKNTICDGCYGEVVKDKEEVDCELVKP